MTWKNQRQDKEQARENKSKKKTACTVTALEKM